MLDLGGVSQTTETEYDAMECKCGENDNAFVGSEEDSVGIWHVDPETHINSRM